MAEGSVAPAASASDKITALLLGIFLGGLGVHRFYVGKVRTSRETCWPDSPHLESQVLCVTPCAPKAARKRAGVAAGQTTAQTTGQTTEQTPGQTTGPTTSLAA